MTRGRVCVSAHYQLSLLSFVRNERLTLRSGMHNKPIAEGQSITVCGPFVGQNRRPDNACTRHWASEPAQQTMFPKNINNPSPIGLLSAGPKSRTAGLEQRIEPATMRKL